MVIERSAEAAAVTVILAVGPVGDTEPPLADPLASLK